MLLTPAESPVTGMGKSPFAVPVTAQSGEPMLDREPPAFVPEHEIVLGRLIRLLQSNERLFVARRALATRLEQARAYLAEPGCHRNLALANLAHLRAKDSGILALLRANRLEAQEILDRFDTEPAGADLDLDALPEALLPFRYRSLWPRAL